MRVDLHPAYVLHRRRYRETSLLLEVLSSKHGKVGLVARGVLRPRNMLGATLQPFRPLQVSWSGRCELVTLTGAETAGQPLSLSGRELFSGFYANEIVMRMIARGDPNTAVYRAYEVALTELADGRSTETALRRFEKSILDAVGYGMNLTREVGSENPVQSECTYYYFPEHGPSRTREEGHCVPVRGSTLLALAGAHSFDPAKLRDAKTLMRFVLKHYMGPRPLASRALFQKSAIAVTRRRAE